MYWVGRGVRILDQILDHVVRPTTPRGATCYVSGRVSRDGEGSLLNADFGALFVSDDRRDLYCCDFDLATIQDEIEEYSPGMEIARGAWRPPHETPWPAPRQDRRVEMRRTPMFIHVRLV